MTRRAWTLAAMADAALPGLLPVGVADVVDRVGEQFGVGFVDDTLGRRWVVRVPGDAVAAAQQDASVALLELLAPRVPFAVPEPAGFTTLRDGRRVMVYPVLPGRPLAFDGLPAGPGFTSTLGRAVAALHNVDRALFEEAGVPVYDADDCRRRRQADIDRGAQTGLVPTGLLSRWERMLDDVAWWRFAPTPVHGHLDDGHILAEFDGDDSATGRVTGMTSWENAQISDPAQDLAALVSRADRAAVAAVLDAYAGARTEIPDAHLEQRAGLLGELSCLTDLLTARRIGDRRHVTHATAVLRELDERVNDGRRGGNRSGTSVDRLPVDFDPAPAEEHWYRAGSGDARPDDTSVVVYPDATQREHGESGAGAAASGGGTASRERGEAGSGAGASGGGSPSRERGEAGSGAGASGGGSTSHERGEAGAGTPTSGRGTTSRESGSGASASGAPTAPRGAAAASRAAASDGSPSANAPTGAGRADAAGQPGVAERPVAAPRPSVAPRAATEDGDTARGNAASGDAADGAAGKTPDRPGTADTEVIEVRRARLVEVDSTDGQVTEVDVTEVDVTEVDVTQVGVSAVETSAVEGGSADGSGRAGMSGRAATPAANPHEAGPAKVADDAAAAGEASSSRVSTAGRAGSVDRTVRAAQPEGRDETRQVDPAATQVIPRIPEREPEPSTTPTDTSPTDTAPIATPPVAGAPASARRRAAVTFDEPEDLPGSHLHDGDAENAPDRARTHARRPSPRPDRRGRR